MTRMSNYRRGYEHERRCKAKLEAEGWFVIRSAGSHSPVDLIGLRAGKILLAQCGLGRKSKAAKLQLADLAEEHGATALLFGPQGSVEVLSGRQAA